MNEQENCKCGCDEQSGNNTLNQGHKCIQNIAANNSKLILKGEIDVIDQLVLDTFHRKTLDERAIGYLQALQYVRNLIREDIMQCETIHKKFYVSSYVEKQFAEYVNQFSCEEPDCERDLAEVPSSER